MWNFFFQQHFYKSFCSEVAEKQLRAELIKELAYLSKAVWRSEDLPTNIATVSNKISCVVSKVLEVVEPYWLGEIKKALTAEIKVDGSKVFRFVVVFRFFHFFRFRFRFVSFVSKRKQNEVKRKRLAWQDQESSHCRH